MKLEELIDSREDRDAILQHCRVTGDDRAEIRDTGDTVIFPVENETLTDRLLTGFGKNGKAYDYTAYDRALDSAWISPRRAGLMMMRLRYPTDLTPEKQAELRQKISENLEKVLKRTAAEKNQEVLGLLCDGGVFTADNIDDAVRTLRGTGCYEMMVMLMNWQKEHIRSDFDYSL